MIATAFVLFVAAGVLNISICQKEGFHTPAQSNWWFVVACCHIGWIGCVAAALWKVLP